MEVSEQREQIAEVAMLLKQGLKRLRRVDLNRAIALLMDYDKMLKTRQLAPVGAPPLNKKSTLVQPIQKLSSIIPQGGSGGENHTGHHPKIEQISAVIINKDKNNSFAFPFVDSTEHTVQLVDNDQLQPLARVIIEQWMRDHYENEVPFLSLYATVAVGHIEIVEENVIAVGQMVHITGQGIAFRVTKIKGSKVFVDRGFLASLFPININRLVPLKKTEVKYFKIDVY